MHRFGAALSAYLYRLVLSIWFGSTLFLLPLIYAVFAVIQKRHPDEYRHLGGEIGGALIPYLTWGSVVTGILLLIFAIAAEGKVGERRAVFRALLILVMMGCSLVAGILVNPRLSAMMASFQYPYDALPAGDDRVVAFQALHLRSSALWAGTVLAGLLILAIPLQRRAGDGAIAED